MELVLMRGPDVSCRVGINNGENLAVSVHDTATLHRQRPCQQFLLRYSLLLLLGLIATELLTTRIEAAEIMTAYAVIKYNSREQLKTFNNKVQIRGNSGRDWNSKETPEATAGIQISHLIIRVQKILGMHPNGLHFTITILDSPEQVQAAYYKQYGNTVDFIAFYSPGQETLYFAANHLRHSVLAHEIAHAVVHRYFEKTPPAAIHELLAQYVEKRL